MATQQGAGIPHRNAQHPLGALEVKNGYPTDPTVATLFDEMDKNNLR